MSWFVFLCFLRKSGNKTTPENILYMLHSAWAPLPGMYCRWSRLDEWRGGAVVFGLWMGSWQPGGRRGERGNRGRTTSRGTTARKSTERRACHFRDHSFYASSLKIEEHSWQKWGFFCDPKWSQTRIFFTSIIVLSSAWATWFFFTFLKGILKKDSQVREQH